MLTNGQRYFYQINEPAASLATGFLGPAYTTSLANVQLKLPTTMRSAPAVTFGGTALSTATFAIIQNSATPIALASTFLNQSALGATNTVDTVALKATTSAALTVGFCCQLVGAGGGAKILISSEL